MQLKIKKAGMTTGLVVLSLIAVGAVVVLVRDILLLSFIGVLFAALMSFPVGFLSKKLPRGVSVLITLIIFLGCIAGLGFAAGPKISEQVKSVTSRLPETVDQIQAWYSRIKKSPPVAQFSQGGKLADTMGYRVEKILEEGAKGIVPATKGLIELMTAIVFIIVLAAFLVYQPHIYRYGIRLLIPKGRENDFDECYLRLGQGLRRWVGGVLVAMTLMGSFAAIGLAIAGIENWLLLGVLTFFGTFVPYLGAISSAIPGLLIGLSQSPKHFLFAGVVYLGVHFIEGYIVQPWIMRRAVEIRPALLLLGQGILATIFGVLGAIVAAPLLVCIQILVQYLYIERYLNKKNELEVDPEKIPISEKAA